jgi:PTH2 family peptidyl-tRNA hydrolase
MVKQVIVMANYLNMRKGKMVAQGAHASMKVLLDTPQPYPAPMEEWLGGRFTKVVVRAESEEELLAVYTRAKEAGLPCALIQDSGATEFHGVPTHTAVAVGPDLAEKIDLVTGHLKLL